MSTLKASYNDKIKKELQQELKIKNPMAVPAIKKIVVNMGVKDALSDKKNIERATAAMAQITGQKPRIAKAKKSIATFKLRQGDPIGVMVTLRGKRMYDFFEKIVAIVLPRIRDFRGISRKSFDGRGNYSLGFSEYTVFPEIDASKFEKPQGIEVTIATTAQNNQQGLELLTKLGMPFQKEAR